MKRETFHPGGDALPGPLFSPPLSAARVLEIGREVLAAKKAEIEK